MSLNFGELKVDEHALYPKNNKEAFMRKNLLTLCILIVVSLVAGCSSSGGGNSKLFETHDHNSDGEISRDEYLRSFDMMDSNGDEVLDSGETGSVLSGH